MNNKPAAKKGLARIWAALFYSIDGLKFAISKETAFRQEICILSILCVILFWLPLSIMWKCLLFSATAAILVVELINSAVETIVDIASPEYHVLAKRAKDLGSAAVLISIILAGLLWAFALFSIYEGSS